MLCLGTHSVNCTFGWVAGHFRSSLERRYSEARVFLIGARACPDHSREEFRVKRFNLTTTWVKE
jgi:hypothetical protein